MDVNEELKFLGKLNKKIVGVWGVGRGIVGSGEGVRVLGAAWM